MTEVTTTNATEVTATNGTEVTATNGAEVGTANGLKSALGTGHYGALVALLSDRFRWGGTWLWVVSVRYAGDRPG